MMCYVPKAVIFAVFFQCVLAGLVQVNKCKCLQKTFCYKLQSYLNNHKNVITGEGDEVLPFQVDISDCTVQPCPLLRGADVKLKIDFFARKYLYYI